MSTSETLRADFETLCVRKEGGVLFADIAAPPMNLLRSGAGARSRLPHPACGGRRHRPGARIQERRSGVGRESAIFGQFGPAFGLVPGGGAVQHLTRLMARSRALEVMLSAEDYDAELAERYGWINRALPAEELDGFVSALAHRIARFPAAGHALVKERVNAIALAPIEEFRRDSDLSGEGVRTPAAQRLTGAAFEHGYRPESRRWPGRACSTT